MPQDKIKSVFDCNIIWQSFFFSSGASAKCKKLVDDSVITLFLIAEVLGEMRQVMTRPEFLAKFETVTEAMIEKYLEQLAKKSVFIRSVTKKFTFSRDSDDEPYINLAIESKADYIVTRDNDLLDLMTGFDDDSKEFWQRFKSLKVTEPLEFLKIVENKDEKVLELKLFRPYRTQSKSECPQKCFRIGTQPTIEISRLN
jgi:putative PIN family toxin of toxin-antitoxin system